MSETASGLTYCGSCNYPLMVCDCEEVEMTNPTKTPTREEMEAARIYIARHCTGPHFRTALRAMERVRGLEAEVERLRSAIDASAQAHHEGDAAEAYHRLFMVRDSGCTLLIDPFSRPWPDLTPTEEER